MLSTQIRNYLFMKNKIYDIYWGLIGWHLREFKRSITNLIVWFPLIWKDRHWDDMYIFDILQFKLKNQAKYISDRDFHLNAKRDAEIMMTCVRLIDKVKNEYYSSEYMDYHESKFEFVDSDYKDDSSEEKYYQMEITELSEHFDDYFKIYPLIYKRVLNGEGIFTKDKEKKTIAINMAHINHDRARKLLFKLLERNIEKWWD